MVFSPDGTPRKAEYDFDTWSYKDPIDGEDLQKRGGHTGQALSERSAMSRGGKQDRTLQDPRCIFQILKRHYQRYTPEMVEEVCGIPPELFLKIAQTICDNSNRERTTSFCYAVAWTHHLTGPQMIRAASIVQTLLGNIGRPGGGILALRGHASIQGSTDIPTLFNLLPGYLAMPRAKARYELRGFCKNEVAKSGWWGNRRSTLFRCLKAWYGDAATEENGYCFDYLPRLTGDHSHFTSVVNMIDRAVQGYFVMGENPTVGRLMPECSARVCAIWSGWWCGIWR